MWQDLRLGRSTLVPNPWAGGPVRHRIAWLTSSGAAAVPASNHLVSHPDLPRDLGAQNMLALTTGLALGSATQAILRYTPTTDVTDHASASPSRLAPMRARDRMDG